MEKEGNKRAARAFASAFAGAASQVLGAAAGSAWPLQVADSPEPQTHSGRAVHFRLSVEGRLRGDCFIEFYEAPIGAFVQALLGQPVPDTQSVDTFEKILANVTPELQTALAGEYGELRFRLERVAGLAFGGMFVVSLAAPADPTGAPVLLYFDCSLLGSFSGEASGQNLNPTSGIDPLNLKLVMDVELNVSLRFGQRQLPLREVLELSSGSIIELDRLVDEPVELLLDGKIIARGEAVIVDGNYGLRVTEIPQPVASHLIR